MPVTIFKIIFDFENDRKNILLSCLTLQNMLDNGI